ncbi:MAG: putative membrane protein [Crocinitomicaceae bacterium]|jgi:uncharacterized membrane protein
MQKMLNIIIIFFISFFSLPVFAQESFDVNEFQSEYISGKVINFTEDENNLRLYTTQLSDNTIIALDTYGQEIEIGSSVFVEYFSQTDTYNFATVNRNKPLLFLMSIFVLSIILLAGKKGLRSLGSLFISMLLLLLVLVPLLIQGFNPISLTLIFGLCILFISIFITHGFNYQSLVSFLGSLSSIILAVILISLVSKFSSLTGLINDEIQFLSFETEQALDLVRIVSASIIIGVLGVLDDITITQVAVVRELSSDNSLSQKNIFIKALRVGRDHISSLVNTLVFAYVGATLPMIMFISLLEIPFMILISQEFIFIEIIRSLIGAIALTLAVPLTTWLACYPFISAIKKDNKGIESACAQHSH